MTEQTPSCSSNIREVVGNTPLVKIQSLSKLTGCEILLKCENMNPGGSIKDRAALGLISDGIASGKLKKGMKIVEGTAGNTGIGLALIGKSLGFDVVAVLPRNMAAEKIRLLELYGAEVQLVDAVPFSNPNHFFHTAARLAKENPEKYWHANQFENLSNFKAHYETTGPEIFKQVDGKLDFLVSAAGTGGTIAGVSRYLKEKIPDVKVILCDPQGGGLYNYVKTGTVSATPGSTIAEGIGILRIVENFKQAIVDDAYAILDQDIVTVANYVRAQDGILLGGSAAVNVTGALKVALKNPGSKIVTFWCDSGERSASKLWNSEFLKSQQLDVNAQTIEVLMDKLKAEN